MQEFHMELSSFQQVQTFVRLAAEQPFEIRVGNDHQRINGKDLMAMGFPQGQTIGKILHRLYDAFIEGICQNQRDDLVRYVQILQSQEDFH